MVWTPLLSPATVREPPTLVIVGATASRSVKVAAWRCSSLGAAPVDGHDSPGGPKHPRSSVISLAASAEGLLTAIRLDGSSGLLMVPRLATPLPVGTEDPLRSMRDDPASMDIVGVPFASPGASENEQDSSTASRLVSAGAAQRHCRCDPTPIPS